MGSPKFRAVRTCADLAAGVSGASMTERDPRHARRPRNLTWRPGPKRAQTSRHWVKACAALRGMVAGYSGYRDAGGHRTGTEACRRRT